MAKVLIVSDSHGLTDELQMIRERHDCDLYLHVGDSELQATNAALTGYEVVRGNCDRDEAFPLDFTIDIAGISLYVTHGHKYRVKRDLTKLSYRAEEMQADVVCYGHSHIANAEQIDHTLYINPGSIRQPRYFTVPTYTIMEIKENKEVTVTFFQLTGETVQELPYENNFHLS